MAPARVKDVVWLGLKRPYDLALQGKLGFEALAIAKYARHREQPSSAGAGGAPITPHITGGDALLRRLLATLEPMAHPVELRLEASVQHHAAAFDDETAQHRAVDDLFEHYLPVPQCVRELPGQRPPLVVVSGTAVRTRARTRPRSLSASSWYFWAIAWRWSARPRAATRARKSLVSIERPERCAISVATVRFAVAGIHGRAKKSRRSRSLSNVAATSPSSRPTSSVWLHSFASAKSAFAYGAAARRCVTG